MVIFMIRFCAVCCIAVESEEECQVHSNAKRRQFGKNLKTLHEFYKLLLIIGIIIKITICLLISVLL